MRKEDKIEIIEESIKKVTILNAQQFSFDEFQTRIELVAKAGQPLMLNWSEGVIFLCIPYQPNSDIIVEKTLQGTMIWANVVFASMPKYESILRFGVREVPVVDQTSIPHLKQVAQWLKNKIEQS